MNLFFDTSALVKLFHEEEGSETVESLVSSPTNRFWVLDLVRLEFLSAIFRRYRNSEIDEDKLDQAISGFDEQLVSFNIEPLGQSVLREAESLLKSNGKENGLRALDALHLAACVIIMGDDWAFVCADKTLCKVADLNGIRVINPSP